MITLTSRPLHFEGAHRLGFLPSDHKCHRLHGHSWSVQFDVRGDVDADGMMIDYADLIAAWQSAVYDVVDHRYLNEIIGLESPTTERIAAWIADRLQKALPRVSVTRVHVREGFAGGEATWTPDNALDAHSNKR